MPASPSADVILWKTSETLIATALVPERVERPAEPVLVRAARPPILDTLAGLAPLPIRKQTGSFPALGVGVVLRASPVEFGAGELVRKGLCRLYARPKWMHAGTDECLSRELQPACANRAVPGGALRCRRRFSKSHERWRDTGHRA